MNLIKIQIFNYTFIKYNKSIYQKNLFISINKYQSYAIYYL